MDQETAENASLICTAVNACREAGYTVEELEARWPKPSQGFRSLSKLAAKEASDLAACRETLAECTANARLICAAVNAVRKEASDLAAYRDALEAVVHLQENADLKGFSWRDIAMRQAAIARGTLARLDAQD